MLRRKILAAVLMLLLTFGMTSGLGEVFAAEETNLVLQHEAFREIEMVAGGKTHVTLELRLREGFCIEPAFSVTPKDNAPLSFSGITVKNVENFWSSYTAVIDEYTSAILEFDLHVDDFASIGTYEYVITYKPSQQWQIEDDTTPEPGELVLSVTVVSEMTPPLISIVSDADFSCVAGETVDIEVTIKNEGELQALNTYAYADYSMYSDVLIPAYTPLQQKVGNMEAGASKKVYLSYRIEEDAKTQLIKLPVKVTSKTANGENCDTTSYVYLRVQAKAVPTPTPTPTPTPVASETTLLLLNNVKQSPASPKAGEKVTVTFYLENKGNTKVTNVMVSPNGLSSSGFEPLTSEPYQYISSIAAGAKKKVEMTFRVGANIPEGLNTLNIQYTYDAITSNGTIPGSESVTIYVLDVKNGEDTTTISRPKLMVSNFYTDVEEVKAGGVFDFTFEILNTNDSIAAKNIKVTVTGASGTFSVTAGGNSFFVSEIEPQQTAPITINLKASAAATTGAYPINIKIEYEYEGIKVTDLYNGETVQEEILLQVKENLRPSVENVYVGSWDTPMVNQATTMSFEFYNMGKSTLNNTYVTVEGDFMLANGSNTYYIGNIAAGMPEYIEFDVVPLVEGDAKGKMIIHMEDSNGDEVTMEKEFSAYVMGEMVWEDPGFSGMYDPGMMDPSVQAGTENVEEPILPLWAFICVQIGILAVGIPVTRAIRLSVYRNKIRREDAI